MVEKNQKETKRKCVSQKNQKNRESREKIEETNKFYSNIIKFIQNMLHSFYDYFGIHTKDDKEFIKRLQETEQEEAHIHIQRSVESEIKQQMLDKYIYLTTQLHVLFYEEYELPYCKYYTEERLQTVVHERLIMEKRLMQLYNKIYFMYGNDIKYMKQIIDPYECIKDKHHIFTSLYAGKESEKQKKSIDTYTKTKTNTQKEELCNFYIFMQEK